MLKPCLRVSCLLLASFLAGASRPENCAVAQQPTTSDAAVEQEIQATADAFVQSFNQRDAAAIAEHWTEDGVYVSEDGQRYEGRQAIRSEYEKLFTAESDLKMLLEIDAVRLISPVTAIEEGRVAIMPQPVGENRVMSQYMAVHVRVDGKWLMANVRDTRVELPPDLGQLEDLEWLVGTWTSGDDKDNSVTTSFRWIENKHFLARSYKATVSGAVTSAGLQVIGVDPSTDQITSWSFSSDGGIAVGRWVPHETGWIVESDGFMKDGTATGAMHALSVKDKNTLLWKSENRALGETLLPDTPEVVLRRN